MYTAVYTTRYKAVYTARVDEHVHGSVWDVYTTLDMARYGRIHGHDRNVPSRPVYPAV